jgi:hypothetical protein
MGILEERKRQSFGPRVGRARRNCPFQLTGHSNVQFASNLDPLQGFWRAFWKNRKNFPDRQSQRAICRAICMGA